MATPVSPIANGEVLLHVGLHKTGTTALQVALADARLDLEQHGVCYPGTSTYQHRAIMGGAGSAVAEALHAAGIELPVLQLGLEDVFIEHGDPARLLSLQGLDAVGIKASITHRFAALLAPLARAA